MENRDIILKELRRVLEVIQGLMAEYTASSHHICTEIIPECVMLRNLPQDKERIITRLWFETQRPSSKLHPEFLEWSDYVWFRSNDTRVKFLQHLISIVEKERNSFYCEECKGTSDSYLCENPSCPNLPCCGKPETECDCKF